MNILNSATRIALLIIIVALVALTSVVVIKNSSDQSVITALVGLFSNIAVAIVSFYFGQKTATTTQTTQDIKTDTPSV